ncbi:hypothetical protein [Haloarchaeobius amylolyticus]|uniref:hypothetical protein n=1 Tax=Haloarchaeobius amylolyticus TaxID=1198296 RepID=UPI00226D554C|nr:hypothetical protein [Haloarchaeobius amylolyticus]
MPSALLTSLRERRFAALALSVSLGLCAAAGAFVTLGESTLLVPLLVGVGGTAYYLLYHGHRLSLQEQDFGRGVLRVFALIVLVDLVTTGGEPLAEALSTAIAVAGLATVFAFTVQLDHAEQ